MIRKLISLILIQYIIPFFSSAQPYIDIVSLQGYTGKANNVTSTKTEDIDINWSAAQFNYPHLFKDSSVLAVNAGYENFGMNFQSSTLSIHTAYLPITYLFKTSAKGKLSFTIVPRFNSETNRSISDKTMQLGGAVIYTLKINSGLSLKGGMYYNREFFGNLFLPLAGGEWKVNNNLTIFGLLPNNLFVDYKVSDLFHTGFIYKGITTSYRLNNDNYSDYFRIQEGILKIFGDLYLTKNIVLNLEAGQTVARKYGSGFLNEEETVIDFNDGFLFKAGLYYRMWLKK
jgi:Domain of unknown function (DUF6268)